MFNNPDRYPATPTAPYRKPGKPNLPPAANPAVDLYASVKNFIQAIRRTFRMPVHDQGFYNDVALGAGLGGVLGGAGGLTGSLGGAIMGGIQGANLNTYNDGVPIIPTSVNDYVMDQAVKFGRTLEPYKDNVYGSLGGQIFGAAAGGLLGGVPGAAYGSLAGAALGGIGGATPNSGYPIRDGMSRPGYRSQYGANPVYGPDEQRYMNQIPPRPPQPWYNDTSNPAGLMLAMGTMGAAGGGAIGSMGGPEGALAGLGIGAVGGGLMGAGGWAYDQMQNNYEAAKRREMEQEMKARQNAQRALLDSQRFQFYTSAPNEPRFSGRVPSQAPPQPVEDERRFMNRVPQMATPDERRFMGRVPSQAPQFAGEDEQRFANRVPSQASPDERRFAGRVPSARPETDEQRFANRVPSRVSPEEQRYTGRVPSQAPPSPFQRNKQADANRSQTQDERRFAGKVPSQAFPPQDERRFDKKPQKPASPKTQSEANRSQAQDERRFMDKKPKSKAIVKPPLDSYIKRYKRD